MSARVAVVAIALWLVVTSVALGRGAPQESGTRVESGDIDIRLTASAGDNDVRLEYLGTGRYHVRDTAGMSVGADCTLVDANTAECANDNAYPIITYDGGGGRDVAVFSTSLPSPITAHGGFGGSLGPGGRDRFEIVAGSPATARFYGYLRADTLIGASRYDFLSGGRGPDRLIGRGGNDRLFGAERKDTFVGGAGNDRLHAANDDGDAAIRCGAGIDVAIIDDGRDPTPQRCERIVRR